MKILHLIQKIQNRGAETFASQIASHQNNIGCEVKIISIFPGRGKLPFNGEIITLDGSRKNRLWDIKAWKKLAIIIHEFKPDIVQANAGDTLKYAVFSKKIYGWNTPVIFRNASEVGRYLRSGLQKKFNQYLYKNIDAVVSVSEASQKDLLYLFPFLKERIYTIPVGLEEYSQIAVNRFEPVSDKHIIHVGGFSFEKNHKGLLRIFSVLLKEHSNIQLHLIGDGPLRSEIQDLVKSIGLERNVKFYGFVPNALSYIVGADVLVLPSIIEGLPGVILEAMYCKVPVVAYNVGGVAEVLNKETGTVVNKGDEKEFVKGIKDALYNENSTRIENARKLVERKYLNREIALSFLKIYTRIIYRTQ